MNEPCFARRNRLGLKLTCKTSLEPKVFIFFFLYFKIDQLITYIHVHFRANIVGALCVFTSYDRELQRQRCKHLQLHNEPGKCPTTHGVVSFNISIWSARATSP
jgi:hypothetical protein